MIRFSIFFRTLALAVALQPIGSLSSAAQSDLGEVYLENSGAPEAQASFQRGLAALHNFWYDVAREEFGKAQSIDPDFALAYWGEALTHDFPFGFNPDVEAARAVLNRLGETPQARQRKAETDIEKRLITAVEALYGEGERQTREQAYYKVMKGLYEDNPDNIEIASFYVLSILGKVVLGRDLREKVEAVAILEPFFDQRPDHPGVLHYMIHAYDDAILAPLALRAANLYAEAAPASSHALHMPSHIFLQLGMWDRTTASNIEAYQASIASAKKRNKGPESYDTHALMWLIYSRTLEGALEDAKAYLDEAKEIRDETGDPGMAFEYALMATRYVVDSSDWRVAPAAEEADDFSNPVVKGSIYLAAGLKAAAEGNLEKTNAMIEAVRGLESVEGVVDDPRRLRITQITRLLLESSVQQSRGDLQKALEFAKQAASLETELALPIGPDYPILPANEVYGKLLLEVEDYSAAVDIFDIALSRRAKRPPALLGRLKAAKAVGDEETAARVTAELTHIWKDADKDFKPAQGLND